MRQFIVLFFTLLFSSFATASLITNSVVIDGKQWAQPTEILGLDWYQIDDVCPARIDGVCSGGGLTLGGFDVEGWTWASAEEVAQMFVASGIPNSILSDVNGSVSAINAPWADNFTRLFDFTTDGLTDMVWGFSRSIHPTATFTAFAPRVFNVSSVLENDQALVGNPDDRSTSIAERGVWLYKTVDVSEPAHIFLLMMGVAMMLRQRMTRKGANL